MSTFADFPGPPWPEDPIGDGMLGVLPSSVSNWERTIEIQPFTNLESSWQSMRTGNGAVQAHTREDGIGPEHSSAETISTSIGSRDGPIPTTADKYRFELSLAHLSRLNARLSQLLGSSRRFLAEPLDPSRQVKNQDPALQVQHSIEAVFRSTNTWLVHGSTNVDSTSSLSLGQTNAFNLLHYVFSASNHMLEILHHVRVSLLTSNANPSPAASSSPIASGLSSSLHVETLTRMSSNEGSLDSSSAVHQLVVICVTLLLNMYVAILTALQRSADALNASRRQRAKDLVEPNDHMDRASRIYLQLVSVVQMCSYFIKRQTQVLDKMMLNSDGPLYTPLSRDCDPLQSISSDAMSDVKTEVEQRLRQLQESLSIIA